MNMFDREGDLITGTVQSVNSNMITLSLGRAESILLATSKFPVSAINLNDKLRAHSLPAKPVIVWTADHGCRSHRNMLRRLLEYEVPEIFNGQ